MTLFLASVRGPEEALTAFRAGADIIDLKEPAEGALGAVAPAAIAATLAALDEIAGPSRPPVSATVGDLPLDPAILVPAIAATAAHGVDYVKFGVFSGDLPGCAAALKPLAARTPLIAVLFADDMPDLAAIPLLAGSGLAGIMIDTKAKNGSSLLDHLAAGDLRRILQAARREGLMAGLAGSLRPAHIPELLELNPDLLGFRGALCGGAGRSGTLEEGACRAIRAAIPRPSSAIAPGRVCSDMETMDSDTHQPEPAIG